MTARGRKSDTMSAIYAAASGLYPAPATRQASRTAIHEGLWQPNQHGRFDTPATLRTNDEIPELLEAMHVRNKNWAAFATQILRQPPHDELDDTDLYARPASTRRR